MVWIALFVILAVFIGTAGKKPVQQAVKLAWRPYPVERYREWNEFGGASFPVLSSFAGAWENPEIRLSDLESALASHGFRGFQFWEEVDGGGADYLDPEDQVAAARAIAALGATANERGMVRIGSKQIHIAELEDVRKILLGGRCVKGW